MVYPAKAAVSVGIFLFATAVLHLQHILEPQNHDKAKERQLHSPAKCAIYRDKLCLAQLLWMRV